MYQWSQTFEISGPGELHVSQRRGRVRIQGSPVAQITVTATSASEEAIAERLDVSQQGDSVHIDVRHAWGLFHLFSGPVPPIDLAITVPERTTCIVEAGSGDSEVTGTLGMVHLEAGSGRVEVSDAGNVEVETGSGGAEVRRVHGSIRLEAGSGDIRLEEAEGDVEVEVGSGNVTAVAIGGDVRIETGSGDLTVADIAGEVDLETGSGNLRADRVRGVRISAETGGGNIQLGGLDVAELDLESSSGNVAVELINVHPHGEYHLETSSGSIHLAVPADAGIQFSVETGSGRVRYDLPLQVVRAEQGELEAVLGGGDAEITIEAGSGDVHLYPLQRPVQELAVPAGAGLPSGAESSAATAPSATPIMDAIRSDTVLSSSEHLRRVLDMVKAGRISPAQAEEILQALDEEDARE